MPGPTTYAEWSSLFDRLLAGQEDERVLAEAAAGTVPWGSGVAENIARRIDQVFSARLQVCSDTLSRHLERAGDDTSVAQAILGARRSLATLHAFATLPCWPAMLREHLEEVLRTYATNTQESLDRSAALDRSGRLLRQVRHNSLLNYKDATARPVALQAPALAAPSSGVRRRNILL